MTSEPDKHETRLSLRAKPETMEMVETYRRAKDKIPSRTDAIEALIREHQPIPRLEIDRLLMDKLPEVLSEKQRKAKIHNLMAELSHNGKIENRGSRGHPAWHTVDQHGV